MNFFVLRYLFCRCIITDIIFYLGYPLIHELVEEKPYDHTADLWALGCILYELFTGNPVKIIINKSICCLPF